jgi:hypothetical protein
MLRDPLAAQRSEIVDPNATPPEREHCDNNHTDDYERRLGYPSHAQFQEIQLARQRQDALALIASPTCGLDITRLCGQLTMRTAISTTPQAGPTRLPLKTAGRSARNRRKMICCTPKSAFVQYIRALD